MPPKADYWKYFNILVCHIAEEVRGLKCGDSKPCEQDGIGRDGEGEIVTERGRRRDGDRQYGRPECRLVWTGEEKQSWKH